MDQSSGMGKLTSRPTNPLSPGFPQNFDAWRACLGGTGVPCPPCPWVVTVLKVDGTDPVALTLPVGAGVAELDGAAGEVEFEELGGAVGLACAESLAVELLSGVVDGDDWDETVEFWLGADWLGADWLGAD